MAKNKPKQTPRPERAAKPACLEGKWNFSPDVPIYDFFEDRDPKDPSDLGEVLQDFLFGLKRGIFLTWEAIVCQELGLPLTEQQAKAIGVLVNFNDEEDEGQILYIDEIPRTREPWYEIVRKIALHALTEPYRTYDSHYDVTYDGWKSLVAALEEHGEGLSLPAGVDRPVDVVPIELQHRLWLQACLDELSGLGQEEELTLKNEEQQDRIRWFIRDLREHKDTVVFLDLTLEKLLTVLILPPQDEPIFIEMMKEQLGLNSMQDKIAGRL
jgi:hypothetical protein